MMWRNADKTFSKRGFSALCLRHRNHLWPELEPWKNEIGMVNICCCQNFGQWCEEILTKPSQIEDSVLYAFGTETTFGRIQKLGRMKMEGSTSIVAKILDNDVKKCWQNLLKARFQCSMPSTQKPRVAGIRTLEEWNWKGQHLLLPKFWTTMWRNADKTFSKRGFSALCLRHRNNVWPNSEDWKNEIEMVNIYCCQNFGQWCEEMLTKPS